MLTPLQSELHLNNIKEFSSHRLENTLSLHNKDLPVNAVHSEKHTEQVNTLCGQNAVFFCVKAGGRHSYHCIYMC
jgi:hypothetical protein